MDKDQLLDELRNFYGTEHYYRHMPGLVITDGVKFLADAAGAYWLLDMVWSYLHEVCNAGDSFFVVLLTKEGVEAPGAVFAIQDDVPPSNTYANQAIDYTDFPLDEIKMYLSHAGGDAVLMLPTEY